MTDPWFPFVKPRSDVRVRVFCFPFAGGGASAYRRWSALLPESIDVRAVQMPGRETRVREAPLVGMAAVIASVVPAIVDHLDRPFALFGHSLGALVAFEVARELRRRRLAMPIHLFASAIAAPHVRDPIPVFDLPDAAFKEELRRLNGTPSAVLENPELMRLFLPMLRADFETSDTYACAPEPPLDVPITVFGGSADAVSRRELDAWSEQTTGPFEVHVVPGGHFFLDGAAEEVVGVVERALRRERGASPSPGA